MKEPGTWGLLNTRQRASLAIALAAILGLATIAALVTRSELRAREEEELTNQADGVARHLQHELHFHGLALGAVQAFFAASDDVTREEFQTFTKTFIHKRHGFGMILWVPFGQVDARPSAKGPTRPEGGIPPGDGPAPPRAEGQPASRRGQGHPILYVEPADLSPMRGMDLGAIEPLRRALDRVRDSGLLAVIPRPESLSFPRHSPRFLMLVPVYRPGADTSTPALRRRALTGHLVADSDPDDLLGRVLHRHNVGKVVIAIHADPGGLPLAFHRAGSTGPPTGTPPALAELRQGPYRLHRVHGSGHRWIVTVKPSRAASGLWGSPLPWLAFGSVAGLGLLLALFLGSVVVAAARARRDAAELAGSKRALEQEMVERASAEEDRARLVTAIEHAEESFIITDLQGLIQYVNPAFERVSGYSRDEVHGESIMLLSSGRGGGAFHKEIFETLERGEVWTGRFQNRRKDGSLYQDEASISPVKDSSGKTIAFVSVQRDITEQLLLESHLRQVHKMEAMGTLAGGIAHDFNNILTAILGHAELALLDAIPGTTVHGSLEEISRAGRRAAALVAQILAFGRRSETERRPLGLHTVVAEALRLLRGSVPPTMEIQSRLDPGCPPVVADPVEIHQVILNFGSNAFHAMREGGGTFTVTLQAEENPGAEAPDTETPPPRWVCLTLSDTGRGMDDATKERIFEPYFTTKKPGEGVGLGLSTVHGIVRRMGGTIGVKSKLGQGTTFTLRLPASRAEVDPTEGRTPQRALSGTERLLVVEDEEQIAAFLDEALGRLGYRVTVCPDGVDALERLKASPAAFDLLVTDQMMPRMTGTELARAARALRPDLPVVLFSGFAEALSDLPTGDPLFAEVLPKPISAETLARTIRRLLGRAPDPPP